MNILSTYNTAPLHDPQQVYKRGDVVNNVFIDFVCVRDHGNSSGTENVDPRISCVINGDGSTWQIWAPGKCYGETAFFHYKVAPCGWIYVKDYVNVDVESLVDQGLKARIKDLHLNPTQQQWFSHYEDPSLGTRFNPLLAISVDMGTDDATKVGTLEKDTFKSHNHVVDNIGGHVHGGVVMDWQDADHGPNEIHWTHGDWQVQPGSTALGGDHTHGMQNTGDDETKPKNVRGFRAIYVGKDFS